MKRDLVVEDGVLCYQGTPVNQMLAYPIWLAALVAGCSHDTLWRARKLGKLKANAVGLISRSELERWLNETGRDRSLPRKAEAGRPPVRKPTTDCYWVALMNNLGRIHRKKREAVQLDQAGEQESK